MDSIHPWLDADELKQLAESLMQGKPLQPPPSRQDAAFGEGFVGFAADSSNDPPQAPAQPAAAVPPPAESPAPAALPPAPAPEPAPVAAIPSATAPPAATNAAPVASSPADDHCLDLQARLQNDYGASQLFILDRDGHTIFGKDHHPQLQLIARSLTRDSERRGLPKGHIHIKVGPDQILEIIPISLPNGGWVIGSVLPQPLSPEQVQAWTKEVSKLSSSLNQM